MARQAKKLTRNMKEWIRRNRKKFDTDNKYEDENFLYIENNPKFLRMQHVTSGDVIELDKSIYRITTF